MSRKSLLVAAICVLAVTACNGGPLTRAVRLLIGKAEATAVVEEAEIAESETLEPETLEDIDFRSLYRRAEQALYKIPNHGKVSSAARQFMTRDLYDALVAAWDVPVWPDGEIGNEEFLWYFLTGNDPAERIEFGHAAVTSIKDGRYYLDLEYIEVWEFGGSMERRTTIPVVMVKENGQWYLDDFDNQKAQCKSYILEEVGNFLSGETTKYMKECQSQAENWYTDEYIAGVEQEFKEYISDYKAYIDAL